MAINSQAKTDLKVVEADLEKHLKTVEKHLDEARGNTWAEPLEPENWAVLQYTLINALETVQTMIEYADEEEDEEDATTPL